MEVKFAMATIEARAGKNGEKVYRVKVRMKGQRPESRTFTRITDAKIWAAEKKQSFVIASILKTMMLKLER